MLDLKYLRQNAEIVKKALATKKFACDVDAFLRIDDRRRGQISAFEALRAELKAAGDGLSMLDKGSEEFCSKAASLRSLSARVKEMESALREIENQWRQLYLSIPNIPHESVPLGGGEQDNLTVATWGNPEKISPHARPHYDIPWFAKALDFARGVKVAGAGFPFYVGDMARLVRALESFFLEEARQKGYIELLPPILVNVASATATGQLPDKESMMYEAPLDGFYMIPTAEVPVTNFYRDEILDEKDLPLYRCAYTPCFRREAGSWGKDVRGLNRLHQFDKVELVKWVHPDKSFEELELLRQDAESLLRKLEIPYRVLAICTGDIGFPHAKQYDLEVWAGGQKRWLEVSSCSNFTDFQARRGNIRFRPADGSKPRILHTLNGSGLAIPRVLAALLENNLQSDFSVKIPAVLKPWYEGDHLSF